MTETTKQRKDLSVVFIPTWTCNCTCDHCFEKINNGHAQYDKWHIFFSRLRDLARFRRSNAIKVYWQGGEVMTMDPEMVRNGMEHINGIFHDSGISVEHHLQTNLILYTSAWKEIIECYFRGSISSSLDFPNLYRRTPLIDPSGYNRCWLAKKEEAEKDGFIISVITLPNRNTISEGAERFYDFFKNEAGIRNLQINFPFPGVKGSIPEGLDPDHLSSFFGDLYDIWISSERYMNLNPFAPLEYRILKGIGGLSCIWSYSCGASLISVGPDGEAGQCDCWLSTLKDFGFGRIQDHDVREILESDNRRPFLERPVRLIRDPECSRCQYWQLCHGGCPVRAYAFSGNIYAKDHYCKVYKQLFSLVIEKNRIATTEYVC